MNSLKGFFLHNLPVKIVALLAACILWAFVMNDQNPAMESGFSVPLTVLNPPGESRITQDAETVKIKLRAPRSIFAVISSDEIKAFVDLAGLEPGTHPMHVQTVIPQGVEVLSVTPDLVKFTIDPIVQKRMGVRIVRSGEAPAGWTVAGIDPETRTVTVVVSNATAGDADIEVSLQAVDEDGDVVESVRIVPKVISARVRYARSLARKVVDVKPTVEGTVAPGYTISEIRVEPARVELAGTGAALDAVTTLSTEPISAADLTESTSRMVSLVLPEGVTVTNKMVNVRIEVKKN